MQNVRVVAQAGSRFGMVAGESGRDEGVAGLFHSRLEAEGFVQGREAAGEGEAFGHGVVFV